jgi:hypothetical protein
VNQCRQHGSGERAHGCLRLRDVGCVEELVG